MIAHLDTHVALWMAAGEKRRLRPVAKYLGKLTLVISPVAIVEMEVLREIGRVREPIDRVLKLLSEDYGIQEATADLADVAKQARSLAWTRDPFDRLIVAHALAAGATLLTADETIRENCPTARWGN